jgi:hypothetical protein
MPCMLGAHLQQCATVEQYTELYSPCMGLVCRRHGFSGTMPDGDRFFRCDWVIRSGCRCGSHILSFSSEPDVQPDHYSAGPRSRDILISVGKCSGVSVRYTALRQILCGGAGSASVAEGLEGAWGLLLAVSLLWITLLPCACQAIKHAEQVRHGRAELRQADEAAARWGPADAREVLQAWMRLGGAVHELLALPHDRVCMEVKDALSAGLEIRPQFISVVTDVTRTGGQGLTVRLARAGGAA